MQNRLVPSVDKNQRIVQLNKLLNSDEKDIFTSAERSDSEMCCVFGNCSCLRSLDHALANLTSNVPINIKLM